MKPFREITGEEIEKILGATTWCPASLEYMRDGGYSTQLLTMGGMPVTMCRLNIVNDLGSILQIAEGWTATFSEKVFDIINKRTDKTWLSTSFGSRLTGKGRFTDVYSVMNYRGANHEAISYRYIGTDLITVASVLSIPVNLYNVDESIIFHPSACSAFGFDNEEADYRACTAYGPLNK